MDRSVPRGVLLVLVGSALASLPWLASLSADRGPEDHDGIALSSASTAPDAQPDEQPQRQPKAKAVVGGEPSPLPMAPLPMDARDDMTEAGALEAEVGNRWLPDSIGLPHHILPTSFPNS